MPTASPRFTAETLRVSARAEAQQPARVVQRASRRLRDTRAPADDRDRRAAGATIFARSRPSSSRARRCRCIASTATRASPKTRRRTRRTSPRSFRRAGCRSTKAPALYFHVSPDEVWIGGGMYAPQPPQLQAVREHIAANVKQLRAIVESPGFRRQVGALEGEKPAAGAARLSQGPSGRRIPEVPAVSRRRASSAESAATRGSMHAARCLPADRAARPVPERAAAAGSDEQRGHAVHARSGSRCCAMGSRSA